MRVISECITGNDQINQTSWKYCRGNLKTATKALKLGIKKKIENDSCVLQKKHIKLAEWVLVSLQNHITRIFSVGRGVENL